MAGQPSVSARQWIQWESDSHPLEPTTTLVLTTPSGSFVDVRFFLPAPTPHSSPDGNGEDDAHRPLPIPLHHRALTTPTSASAFASDSKSTSLSPSWHSLEWAFAGTSVRSTLPASPSSQTSSTPNPKKTRCTWTHTVSSRFTHPTPQNSSDTGIMTPQTQLSTIPASAGARKATDETSYEYEWDLERGSMLHPLSGRIEAYEEAWVEVAPLVDSIGSFTLEDGRSGNVIRNDGSNDELGRRVRVYTVLHPRHGTHLRGKITRIGHWAQGIARLGEVCAVERWMMSEKEAGERGTKERDWVRLFSTCSAEGPEGGDDAESLRRVLERGMEEACDGGGGGGGGGKEIVNGAEWEVVEHGDF